MDGIVPRGIEAKEVEAVEDDVMLVVQHKGVGELPIASVEDDLFAGQGAEGDGVSLVAGGADIDSLAVAAAGDKHRVSRFHLSGRVANRAPGSLAAESVGSVIAVRRHEVLGRRRGCGRGEE